MAHAMQGVFLTAALVLACSAAAAQPNDNPTGAYPNTANFGVEVDRSEPWFQQCLRVQHIPAPGASVKPASCKSFDYYDKLAQVSTSRAEWDGVRACALASNDFAVLAMLSANGLGVPRDVDLAIQYACRAGGAKAEVTGRIAHLQSLQATPAAKPYDQCDDITSGYMGAICFGIAEHQAAKVRSAFITHLRRQLPAGQQVALDQLANALQAYSRARQGEVDMQGTGAPAAAAQAQAREQEWSREHLAAFEKGVFNLSPPQELAEDDAELNRLYGLVMAAADTDHGRLPGSTVQKTDVRAAQRLWLAYRDAWIRFAALRYPTVPSAAIAGELTTWRSGLLRKLLASAR